MKIKRSPLIFHNVLSTKVICNKEEWLGYARELRNSLVKSNLYSTGPIIYKRNKLEDSNKIEAVLYLPINAEIELKEDTKYEFIKELKFDDGLTLRHADLDDDLETVTYDTLREAAKKYNLELVEPFYNIYLDVFGDGVIDVYAPIISNNN